MTSHLYHSKIVEAITEGEDIHAGSYRHWH